MRLVPTKHDDELSHRNMTPAFSCDTLPVSSRNSTAAAVASSSSGDMDMRSVCNKAETDVDQEEADT